MRPGASSYPSDPGERVKKTSKHNLSIVLEERAGKAQPIVRELEAETPSSDRSSMCFYNQKRFACGDWSWTSFAHQCNYEYRTGETCGMRLVNVTEFEPTKCRLCEKIETKHRRRVAELERLERWKGEGGTLVASMDRSRKVIMELDKEIRQLQNERETRRKALG
ncbi:hypothetical protein DTO212C5_5076 [Paecilomyces variotii]|nr:hypothetical protein DTO212C5_5076 [Paecilomyces variotii]